MITTTGNYSGILREKTMESPYAKFQKGKKKDAKMAGQKKALKEMP